MENKLNPIENERREARRARARSWYEGNKQSARRYYAKNRDKIKKRSTRWQEANRERYLTYQRNYNLKRRKK